MAIQGNYISQITEISSYWGPVIDQNNNGA